MRLSFDWLCDYVDLDGITPQEVAEKLTMGAFEVEEVKRVGANLKGPVVVGQILEIYPHPDPKATRIRMTKTRVAPGAEPLEIICGAPNIEVGNFIPVALPGASVLNRKTGEGLDITVGEIRGARSNGMLCSAPELGLPGDENAGIIIFPDHKYQLGADVLQLLDLRCDWVLHVEPRSNRGDALSVIGLAREVAALTKRPFKEPQWSLSEFAVAADLPSVSVVLEDTADCPFFSIRVIGNLSKCVTPAFIQRRLEAVGVRTVSPIVDVTNYVLHELGQPLHAYDLNKISGNKFNVRRAKAGEKLVTIDAKERQLTDEILVIADAEKPVGVAGVMGGKDSEIDESTLIALEAASFTPARVRRASRLLGLSSDSSLRFERGVDLASVHRASDRAAYLLLKHCLPAGAAGQLGSFVTGGSDNVRPLHLKVRLAQAKKIIAHSFTPEQVKELLSPLGFIVTHSDASAEPEPLHPGLKELVDNASKGLPESVQRAFKSMEVSWREMNKTSSPHSVVDITVPSFRQNDVVREIDVIEEICRLWGYDRVPISMPVTNVPPRVPDDAVRLAQDTLCGLGLTEAWVSSLTGVDDSSEGAKEAEAAKSPDNSPGNGASRGVFGLFDESKAVRVLNPLSSDHQVLRQSLIPGLVKVAQYNHDRGNKDLWLFETGRIYIRQLEGSGNGDRFHSGTGVVEPTHVAGFLMGMNGLSEWFNQSKEAQTITVADFYQTKAIVENLLGRFRVDLTKVRFKGASSAPAELESDNGCHYVAPACLHPVRSCQIYGPASSKPELLGWLGQLHPALQDKFGFRQAAYVFELSLDSLSGLRRGRTFTEISNTPSVVRDLTADLAEKVDHGDVSLTIRKEGGSDLRLLELTKIYELVPGMTRSLTYRLHFQNPEKTLTNEEVEKRLEKIRGALKHKHGADFRI